jgi:hypothetical protein
MKFISLQSLRATLEFDGDFSDRTQLNELLSSLEAKSENGELTLDGQSYSSAELQHFLEELDLTKVVFLDWIDQHASLKSLLIGKVPTNDFTDAQNWKGHTMYAPFQAFLSPYLLPQLLRFKENEVLEVTVRAFSYAQLLPETDRMFIEQLLFKGIQERFTASKDKIEAAENEQALLEEIHAFCSDDMLRGLNYLSRSSYATKLWYVDQLLWIVKQKACTVRLANWLLKQLKKIELNPEHLEKITELKRDLKDGKIRVKNTLIQNKIHVSFRSIAASSLIVGLLALVVWIVWKKPFSETPNDINQSATSFEQFTKEERIKIDSMLTEIEHKYQPDLYDTAAYNPLMGNGVSLAIRVPLKNERMEELYKDLLIDADLHNLGVYDTTSPVFTSKQRANTFYSGVNDLNKKTGKHLTLLKNESGYDVYCFVYSNQKKGDIYSAVVKKGASINLHLNSYEQVLFVPGNKLGKYKAPKNQAELPSKTFDHHFTEVDINYTEGINTIYYLANPQPGTNKLLLTGDKGTYFTVVDLYGILELF